MIFNLDPMDGYVDDVKAAINNVIDKRQFILGEQVRLFESEWAEYTGQAHAIGVGNGTDALRIALLALGVKPGDEVISPAFNVAYTALAVASIGAVNVFVDCDPHTKLMDLGRIREVVTRKTRVIVPVHLYGRLVDVEELAKVAREYGLMILEDAAQAHGAKLRGKGPGSFSHAVAYSHYPTKNLGALGEAGSITTNIDVVAEHARLLRDGGRTDRYLHSMVGINSCLDEMQAAVLRVKLRHLDHSNRQRRIVAQHYTELALIPDVNPIVDVQPDAYSVHHLYVIRVKYRDELHAWLKKQGIPSLIHYPVPVPYQPCFMTPTMGGPWPRAEQAAREVLSLPMYPTLSEINQASVIEEIRYFYGA